jgi:hypothetical protein
MNAHRIVLLALAVCPTLASADSPGVPRITNGPEPAEGVAHLRLEELWRAGGLDGDVLLGVVADVAADKAGNVYVLDNQLCQVMVFSPRGEHLRDLSRQGEGPGEIQQPTGLVMLPDETMGIVMGYPGRIVRMKLDGTPLGNLYPTGDPAQAGYGVLREVRFRDGTLVACGAALSLGTNGTGTNDQFLSLSGLDCQNLPRFLEKSTPMQLAARKYVEADDYYVIGRWDLAPDGRIYAAADRDRYEISVFDGAGDLVQVIEREYAPRKRTPTEMDRVGSDMIVVVNGEAVQFDRFVEDHDECIRRLVAAADGSIWVLTPHGAQDQPEGSLETWDVFDAGGRFRQQMAIPLGDEMHSGLTFFPKRDLLVAVKGAGDQPVGDEEAEREPLEVIGWALKSTADVRRQSS